MKGSVDLIVAFVLVFVVALALIAIRAAWDVANTATAGVFSGSAEATAAVANVTTTFNIMDGVFFITIIAIGLAAIATSFFLESHPLYFIAMMFSNIVLVILNGIFSNTFAGFAASGGVITTAANSYALTVAAMQYMPIISLVIAFISAVLFYGKGRQ